eukprot:Hpha_TRINITY_DN16635_c1_g7::TRINITY_DN16635_c1_g7_i1::g.180155::m.180155
MRGAHENGLPTESLTVTTSPTGKQETSLTRPPVLYLPPFSSSLFPRLYQPPRLHPNPHGGVLSAQQKEGPPHSIGRGRGGHFLKETLHLRRGDRSGEEEWKKYERKGLVPGGLEQEGEGRDVLLK